jgi:hypothetical protein
MDYSWQFSFILDDDEGSRDTGIRTSLGIMAGGMGQVWEMMTADNPDTRFLFWATFTIRTNDKIIFLGLVSHTGRSW